MSPDPQLRSRPSVPSQLEPTYVYSPTIALDGSGRLIAAWVHFENSMEYINLPGNVVTTAIAVARYQP